MAGLNKIILIGYLGRDPELRHTPNGTPVADFSIATNERWKDKEGNPQERTEWHNIVAMGRQAEICGEYLSKGRQVYIEGRIQTRSWEDKDGNKRNKTDIMVRQVIMLGSKEEGAGTASAPRSDKSSGAKAAKSEKEEGADAASAPRSDKSSGARAAKPEAAAEADPDYSDDDIPF